MWGLLWLYFSIGLICIQVQEFNILCDYFICMVGACLLLNQPWVIIYIDLLRLYGLATLDSTFYYPCWLRSLEKGSLILRLSLEGESVGTRLGLTVEPSYTGIKTVYCI